MLRSVAAAVKPRMLATVEFNAVRAYSMEGVRGYSEKEAVEERLYFSKEDERALRKLLGKAKKQADTDATTASEQYEKELKELKGILGKYSVSESDLNAVIKWRHSDDH